MRKLFILFAFMTFTNVMSARDIHWITFVDTTDPNVGETDVSTRQILYSRWINIINSALAPEGYGAKVYDYTGSRTSPQNCKDLVQNLLCKPEDIIVFYYIGHGARSTEDKSRYPQMALAQNYDELCVPLEWVHKTLKEKNARLTITIGMCCNSYVEGLSAKEKVAFSMNQGHSYVKMDAISNIQQLFLKKKGDIIISSSDKGQASWGGYMPGIGLIDCFSHHLIKVFTSEVDNTVEADWETILADVQTAVDQETLEASRQPGSRVTRQTPIFDINIEDATNSDGSPNTPIPPTPSTSVNKEELLYSVSKTLDYIISEKPDRKTRDQVAKDLLQKCFASNAIVRILGQDVDVVIDKPSAEDYFGNLSFTTKQLPLKVVVVDCELNNSNKIKSLIVREVYKK